MTVKQRPAMACNEDFIVQMNVLARAREAEWRVLSQKFLSARGHAKVAYPLQQAQ